jgi:hypothetical protein
MSGPIVRKYGFPNFEKIFGQRPLEHGVEEDNTPEEASIAKTAEADAQDSASQPKTGKKSATKPKR